MENLRDVRINDMKKMFPRWSHGTLYNRLKKLQLKDNSEFMYKNSVGSIMYKMKAVELLKVEYLTDFSNNTEEDQKKLDNQILSVLSNEDLSTDLGSKTNKEVVNVDKVDNQSSVELINLDYISKNYVSIKIYQDKINELKSVIKDLKEELEKEKEDKKENYITKDQHNEVVRSIEKQVELVKEQLQSANEIVRFKEQKDLYIEQSKALGDGSEKMSWWRKLFPKKEKNIEQ